MKTLILFLALTSIYSSAVMAEKMFAYYEPPKTAEDEAFTKSIPGKLICFYSSPFQDKKSIRISKVIDIDKQCPLVLDLSTPDKTK